MYMLGEVGDGVTKVAQFNKSKCPTYEIYPSEFFNSYEPREKL